jgi:hypothetical protein
MEQVRLDSKLAFTIEPAPPHPPRSELALEKGQRVFLLTIEGEFPARVVKAWTGGNMLIPVRALLDGAEESRWIRMHRKSFRAFSVLDLLADV